MPAWASISPTTTTTDSRTWSSTDLANQKYALYRNNGNGTFNYAISDSRTLARMTMLHSGWGVRFLDYDNDGWKDLLIAQGHDLDTIEKTHPQLHYREPMLLLRNTGTWISRMSRRNSGDVFQQAVGRPRSGHRRHRQRRPRRCGGDHQRRSGARPAQRDARSESLADTESCRAQEQSRRHRRGSECYDLARLAVATVTTACSYLSSSDKRVHFGLGADTVASGSRFGWPSGIQQTLVNVAAGQILNVDEPSEARHVANR